MVGEGCTKSHNEEGADRTRWSRRRRRVVAGRITTFTGRRGVVAGAVIASGSCMAGKVVKGEAGEGWVVDSNFPLTNNICR